MFPLFWKEQNAYARINCRIEMVLSDFTRELNAQIFALQAE